MWILLLKMSFFWPLKPLAQQRCGAILEPYFTELVLSVEATIKIYFSLLSDDLIQVFKSKTHKSLPDAMTHSAGIFIYHPG